MTKEMFILKYEILELISKRDINIVFQPIISLRSGDIYGYEALSRGTKNTPFENPELLFKKAYEYNLVWELEYLCRSKALEKFSNIETDAKLFLNVNPNIMHDVKFKKGFTKEYLEVFNIDASKIVFEITEREAIYNVSDFINTVENYKVQDYSIAIDDVGSGYSGLNLISEVYPHFIKLDMKLIRHVDKDFIKQALVKSMCEYANLTNTYLIAEGIETEEELSKLIEMGVHYGQGYFIKYPSADICPIESKVADIIKDSNRRKNHYFGKNVSDFYVENIVRKLNALNSNIKVNQVDEMLKQDVTIPGYCILDEEDIVGIITQNEFYKHLSGLYGYNLYGNKPIKEIMSKEFLGVDCKATIDVVAKKAMLREIDKIYDFIIVTKENKYQGIVTVKDLLEKSIEIEVMNAKNLNPLSELPGNVVIESNLMQSINGMEEAYIMYFDIDNFKAYNDVYGFENGDRVIVFLTQVLKSVFEKNEFIGHIGGDDFIAITQTKDIKRKAKRVIKEFESNIHQFYREDDYKKGFIISRNRKGVEECFPLISISIACLSNRNFSSVYELGESATRLKKKCKQLEGSNYLIID